MVIYIFKIIVIAISKAINMRTLSIKCIDLAVAFEAREGPGIRLRITWLTVR